MYTAVQEKLEPAETENPDRPKTDPTEPDVASLWTNADLPTGCMEPAPA